MKLIRSEVKVSASHLHFPQARYDVTSFATPHRPALSQETSSGRGSDFEDVRTIKKKLILFLRNPPWRENACVICGIIRRYLQGSLGREVGEMEADREGGDRGKWKVNV